MLVIRYRTRSYLQTVSQVLLYMIRIHVHKDETNHHGRQDGETEPVDSVPRGSRAQVAARIPISARSPTVFLSHNTDSAKR